ncbi:MAG: S8 family serine peptidase [Mycobacteriales bacterium]|nr:S8 family serine peptidase [Mycobacteriales bacterium]
MPASASVPPANWSTALPRRRSLALLLLAALGASTLTSPAVAAQGSAWTSQVSTGVLDPGLSAAGDALTRVIVTAGEGVSAAARAVSGLGGDVTARLDLVGGVSASVPASLLDDLAGVPGVTAVTADTPVRFENMTYDEATSASSFVKTTKATAAWSAGNLGAGVGVAVLDTGISQMKDFEGRLVHGPDLSGEGTVVDSYGHGTVMAGAVGGSGADSAGQSGGAYTGVAPKAHLVAVKVAGRNGATDVSTVLQGMHWVSAYKDQFNIRVLNLSWGTASTQDPAVDPLNYAVQRLWKQGIVVVVAAGNSGPNAGTIMKPGDDPMVLTVGAYDDKGTLSADDDTLAAWSSRGPTAQGVVKPDVVAPGRSLVLPRSYGSYVEQNNPKALVPPSYIRGSGTSQAAAVTSGLAALLIAARPELTPDQVKALLMGTAVPLGTRAVNDQGSGRVDLAAALSAPAGAAQWQTGSGSGLGSIEASRGGRHVETPCGVIVGEIDVRCEAWNGSSWTGSSWTGSSWTGSSWTGSSWTGSSWTGSSWTGSSWTGSSWTGGTWTGSSWTGSSWTGSSWTGSSWTGSSWTGSSWTGSSWTGSSWTGSSWTTAEYDEFLTAFWGQRPPRWKTLPGEVSDSASTLLV